ncbi:MAG: hypothetical protein H0Z40_09175 [Desulfotomaculum sp.]|nr:hypothetical protein [Desulfotomaculum sp.]
MTNEGKILKMLETLTNDVAGIKSDVAELKRGQQRIETRIKNELVDKVRALFDAREVQGDINTKILDKLEDIEINTNYTAAKVSRLKQVVK